MWINQAEILFETNKINRLAGMYIHAAPRRWPGCLKRVAIFQIRFARFRGPCFSAHVLVLKPAPTFGKHALPAVYQVEDELVHAAAVAELDLVEVAALLPLLLRNLREPLL